MSPVLPAIERFLADTGMTPTTFGKLAVRDPRLVFDVRKGRKLHARVRARVEGFMAQSDAPNPLTPGA